MKTASVRDLRTRFPYLEAWLEEGEAITITKHNKVVATLVAPTPKAKPNFKRRFVIQKRVKASRINILDLLSEERGQ